MTTISTDSTPSPEHQSPLVAIGMDAGTMGLSGWWKLAGNMTAMGLIAGSFLYLQYTITTNNRSDRLDDRAMFRESMKDLRDQADRHTGEMKGALDANTSAAKELAGEIKGWRTSQPGKGMPNP